MEMDKTLLKLTAIGHILCADGIELSVWENLVHALEVEFSDPPEITLRVSNPDRKWELVSAYQKSVRRSDLPLALKLVSAMVSMTDERDYMKRRVMTTSAEDIGAGDPLIMKFVIAAFSVYPNSSLDEKGFHALMACTTKMLCDAQKSRVYCQYTVVKDYLNAVEPTTPYRQKLKAALNADMKELCTSECDKWLLKANWRGEGMLTGTVLSQIVGTELVKLEEPVTATRMSKGLPDYCYDMHTRVGKTVHARLCSKDGFKQFFSKVEVPNKATAIGWAVFYEEGSNLLDRVGHPELETLEQENACWTHKISMAQWQELRTITQKQIKSGAISIIRTQVLESIGY